MTWKTTSLMLGIGLLAASAGLAAAADWNNGAGGIKVYRNGAAVPVPAPSPIPVHAADWYVRADLNFAATSSGSVGSSGPRLDLKDPDEMPRYFGGGIAVGRYLTPSIRADISLDYRSQQRFASGTTVHTDRTITRTNGTITDTDRWTDTYSNEARIGNYAAMLNGYYDFRTGSPFTPYLGAGVGISMHMLSRTASDTHSCTMDSFDSASGTLTTGLGCGSSTASFSNGNTNSTAYGFAGALMAGVAYEVSPGVLWDSGYRLMYTSGKVAQTSNTGLGASMISIGDRVDHEFRTGVRWNID